MQVCQRQDVLPLRYPENSMLCLAVRHQVLSYQVCWAFLESYLLHISIYVGFPPSPSSAALTCPHSVRLLCNTSGMSCLPSCSHLSEIQPIRRVLSRRLRFYESGMVKWMKTVNRPCRRAHRASELLSQKPPAPSLCLPPPLPNVGSVHPPPCWRWWGKEGLIEWTPGSSWTGRHSSSPTQSTMVSFYQ